MSHQGNLVSPQTSEKLKTLIGERPGDKGGYAQGSGVRQVVHVLITSGPDDHVYGCTPTAFKADDGSWDTYDGALVLEANLGDLRVGDRYLAVRYGFNESQEKYVFITDNQYPLLGCHLDYLPDEEDDDKLKLVVTPETLAGTGLVVELGEDGCYRLAVDTLPDDGSSDSSSDSDSESSSSDGPTGGPAFSAITSLVSNGCGITYNVTPFFFVQNRAGVLIGFEAGEPVSHDLDLSACCDCSSDSDSDSSSGSDSDSGSDSGSDSDSSSGGLGWPCCLDVPETLYMTTSNASGCSCLDSVGTITLTYNPATEKWEGSGTVCTNPVAVEFNCHDGVSWRIDIDGTVQYTTVATCSPFYFNLSDVYFSALCEGNGNITITE